MKRSVGFLARKKWIVLAGIAVFAAYPGDPCKNYRIQLCTQ